MSSGYLIGLVAAMSYGLMSFLVHMQAGKTAAPQLVFYRGLVTVILLLPFCSKQLSRYFTRADGPQLWSRALFGSMSVLCYFYALQGTTSGNANLMFSTTPVFVTALAWIFYSERINFAEAGGVALVVMGNVLLYLPNQGKINSTIWLVGFAGALFASLSLLALGAAAKKHSGATIVWGFGLFSLLFSLLIPEPWKEIQLQDLPLILLISLLGVFSQLTATHSFKLLKSPIAAALGRTSILFSGLLDIFAAQYQIHFLELLSYVVVLIGVFIVHFYRDKNTEGPGGAPA
jgi:drug/metabolite transporter (DMT)-like permease